MAERIQLQRRRGWRLPANTVKVDRSTRWGNPFRVQPGYTAAEAVADYRRWIGGAPGYDPVGATRPSVADIRAALAHRNLACWCAAGAACHADVLLEIANAHPGDVPLVNG